MYRLATAILLSVLSGALGAQPTFRADARHSGIYEEAGVPVLHGAKWKFHAGGPIVSTPAVSAGLVFFGSSDHNFYAVAQHTGELRWKFPTHGRVTALLRQLGRAAVRTQLAVAPPTGA